MQTKKQSFFESLTNTAIGFIVSYASTFLIFPLVGMQTSASTNLLITIYFTIISILRGYVIRRWFNKKKLITYPNNKAFRIYCLQCRYETVVYRKDDRVHCSNCDMLHISN
jgi:ribosomal protein S27E